MPRGFNERNGFNSEEGSCQRKKCEMRIPRKSFVIGSKLVRKRIWATNLEMSSFS
jgi:hypothetical protein